MEKNNKKKLAVTNAAVFAYIGDAVYEMYVRKHVFEKGLLKPDRLHHAAVRYVRAEAQAEALKQITPQLDELEMAVVRRAKNKKITSMPKHVDPMIYKWATGLEALIGFLYLAEDINRMEEIIHETFRIIEEAHLNGKEIRR